MRLHGRAVGVVAESALREYIGIVGMHLGRFREAYTEMIGMMAGMMMAVAVAVEQRPVVALQQAVQPADDLPVEPLEDALRR